MQLITKAGYHKITNITMKSTLSQALKRKKKQSKLPFTSETQRQAIKVLFLFWVHK